MISVGIWFGFGWVFLNVEQHELKKLLPSYRKRDTYSRSQILLADVLSENQEIAPQDQ